MGEPSHKRYYFKLMNKVKVGLLSVGIDGPGVVSRRGSPGV